MKQYRILSHEDNSNVLVSVNSLDYASYLLSGYVVIKEGNRKELEQLMELIDTDGALAD